MDTFFSQLSSLSLLSITVRLLLTTVFAGTLGYERERHRQAAGFRTYIIVADAAALVMMTNLYIGDVFGSTDLVRMPASVITGLGFLGAGTILVTKSHEIKGLTTAAGLWTAAIIGLVCGAGYVECAIFATAMVLVAELLLIKIEYRFAGKINDVNLYVEYAHAEVIENILRAIRDKGIKLGGIEINRIAGKDDEHHYCAVITLRANKKQMDEDVIKELNGIEDVLTVEEL